MAIEAGFSNIAGNSAMYSFSFKPHDIIQKNSIFIFTVPSEIQPAANLNCSTYPINN